MLLLYTPFVVGAGVGGSGTGGNGAFGGSGTGGRDDGGGGLGLSDSLIISSIRVRYRLAAIKQKMSERVPIQTMWPSFH